MKNIFFYICFKCIPAIQPAHLIYARSKIRAFSTTLPQVAHIIHFDIDNMYAYRTCTHKALGRAAHVSGHISGITRASSSSQSTPRR